MQHHFPGNLKFTGSVFKYAWEEEVFSMVEVIIIDKVLRSFALAYKMLGLKCFLWEALRKIGMGTCQKIVWNLKCCLTRPPQTCKS